MVARRLADLLLIGVALYLAGFSTVGVIRRLSMPHPHDPFEAGQTVEAWRSAQGLPLYEPAGTGHATIAYGLAGPRLLGALFQLTGPSNQTGRVLALLAALAWGALLLRLAGGHKLPPFALLLAASVFWAINGRTSLYFAANRMDVPALLLATVAVAILYRAALRDRPSWHLLGTVILVLAFTLKQTALMAAAIPIGAAILLRSRGKSLAWSLLPLAGGLLAFGLVLRDPLLTFYSIEVPARQPTEWGRGLREVGWFLISTPLFIGSVILLDKRHARTSPFTAWLLSALGVTWLASAWTLSNAGATDNSWLPAYGSLFVAFAIVLRERLWPWYTTASTGRGALRAAALATLCFATFPSLWRFAGYMPVRNEYRQVVQRLSALDGDVLMPEDPTALVLAKQLPTRTLHLEVYAHPTGEWRIPDYVMTEFRRADVMVDVEDWWGDLIAPDSLRSWGFEPSERMGRYVFWRRTTSGAPR